MAARQNLKSIKQLMRPINQPFRDAAIRRRRAATEGPLRTVLNLFPNKSVQRKVIKKPSFKYIKSARSRPSFTKKLTASIHSKSKKDQRPIYSKMETPKTCHAKISSNTLERLLQEHHRHGRNYRLCAARSTGSAVQFPDPKHLGKRDVLDPVQFKPMQDATSLMDNVKTAMNIKAALIPTPKIVANIKNDSSNETKKIEGKKPMVKFLTDLDFDFEKSKNMTSVQTKRRNAFEYRASDNSKMDID